MREHQTDHSPTHHSWTHDAHLSAHQALTVSASQLSPLATTFSRADTYKNSPRTVSRRGERSPLFLALPATPHSTLALAVALKRPSQPLKYPSQPLKSLPQLLKKPSTLALAKPASSPQHSAASAFTDFSCEEFNCHLSVSHWPPPYSALPVPRSALCLPLRIPHSTLRTLPLTAYNRPQTNQIGASHDLQD